MILIGNTVSALIPVKSAGFPARKYSLSLFPNPDRRIVGTPAKQHSGIE